MPVIGGAVAGGVIALVIASGIEHDQVGDDHRHQPRPSRPRCPPRSARPAAMTINQIYKSASPGVVDIVVTTSRSRPRSCSAAAAAASRAGRGRRRRLRHQGRHPHRRARRRRRHHGEGQVPGRQEPPAKVIGTDPSTDVGVIKVNAPSSELHPIPFADSSQAQVGDPVVAIGSPFSLPETTTHGHRQPDRAQHHRRPTTSRSPARSRPTRRSTPATRADRCSTPTGTCSASTTRSRPTTRLRPGLERRRRLRDPVQHGHADRRADHRRHQRQARVRRRLASSIVGRDGAEVAQITAQSARPPPRA